ncbi:MAG: GSU2403 family nucleotidyltransferase fold protein [Candidatus Sedimenticola sp. 20ELBAFRAG]
MSKSSFSASRLDLIAKTFYSEAVEKAFTQGVVDPLPPGNISMESRERGGMYARWRRIGPGGKPLAPQYLGPEGGDRHLEAIASYDELSSIARSAKVLRDFGFATEDNLSAVTLAAFHNAGVFSGGGVLVGTRAFRCLANYLGFKVRPVLTTQDIDIARGDRIALALPFPKGGMHEFLKQTGLQFSEVPGLDHRTPATAWKVRGRELKVDLLVPGAYSSKPYQSIEIPELGAYATSLPGLKYLISGSIETISIGKTQLVPVRVPTPGRFLWHKIAVSTMRPAALRSKAEKDLIQAACLAACMIESDSDELYTAVDKMPKWMRNRVENAFPLFVRQFGDSHRDVVELMADCVGISLTDML